jgi:hypothetical protein
MTEKNHPCQQIFNSKITGPVPDHADKNIDGIRIWNISYHIQ